MERHKAALRSYVQALSKGETAKVEAVVEAVWKEAQTAENAEFEEDPTVWLFARARRRVIGAGQRDALAGEAGGGPADDEAGAEDEEPRVVVHRTIGGLTARQQETLRLKFQFNLNLEEIASITGQAKSGTGWLLHQAIVRIGKALGGRDDDASPLAGDPRVTAYALDEMDASERGFFEKGVMNGKALLEREKAIRVWGGHITEVLSSGAPVPKRRRKKRGAAWWKNKALWAGLALAVVAGIYWAVRQKSADRTAQADRGLSRGSPEFVADQPAEDGPNDLKPAAAGGGAGMGSNASRGLKEPRTATPRNSAAVDETGGRKGGQAPASAHHAGANPGARGNPHEDLFRHRSEHVKPAPRAGEENARERPATPGSPGADTGAMFAGNPASAPTGSGGSEATREIDLVRDQPGPGKPAEEVDVIPVMGGWSRQLALKQWPRREQVRLEEMLKHIPVGPRPATENPIETHLERARSPWDGRKQIVRVTLRAKDSPAPARGAANLVFAIDVSKSMTGPNRLPLVQEGVRRLVDRLRPDDLISVVTYAAKADVALAARPAAQAGELRQCLAGLEAAGLTNGSAGLRLAYATARRHWIEGGLNVVVLCTDGNFNLGTTDESALAALAAAEAENGVQLSVFGFGRTDRNDLRLEILATNGGGRSCYVNTEEEAERLLVEQIDGLFAPVAKDVRLQVEFNRALVADFRRIGDEAGQDTTGAVGVLLPGRSITALFEVTPGLATDGSGGLGRLQLGYTLPETGELQQQTMALAGAEQAWSKTGLEFRFAVAMAEFGRILGAGQPGNTAELDRLEAWVRANLMEDAGGYRTELLQNLELARAMVQGPTAGVEGGVSAQ